MKFNKRYNLDGNYINFFAGWKSQKKRHMQFLWFKGWIFRSQFLFFPVFSLYMFPEIELRFPITICVSGRTLH